MRPGWAPGKRGVRTCLLAALLYPFEFQLPVRDINAHQLHLDGIARTGISCLDAGNDGRF